MSSTPPSEMQQDSATQADRLELAAAIEAGRPYIAPHNRKIIVDALRGTTSFGPKPNRNERQQPCTHGEWKATQSVPSEGFDCWWITANLGHNQEKEIGNVRGGQATSRGNALLFAASKDLYWFVEQFFNGLDTDMIEINSPADETLANVIRKGREALKKARGGDVQ